MKVYDISQEVFGCQVFPGDPAPQKNVVMQIDKGDVCNLTTFSMCAHNGTHIDAPYHFINNGRKVRKLPLETFVGRAYVAEYDGSMSAEAALEILNKATAAEPESRKRIIIKGKVTVSVEAAQVFAEDKPLLLGNESQTFGGETEIKKVHEILLGAGIVLLEGIRLEAVAEGVYSLYAAPLNLGDADGAPCRAVLMEE